MKKILLLILIISLFAIPISSCTPASEPDEPLTYSEGLEFKLDPSGAGYSVFLGTCDEENIIIPTYDENGKFIARVGFGFEDNRNNIKSIRFMDDREVLYGSIRSDSLEYIEFPQNLKVIGRSFLSHCTALKSVTIPDGVIETNRLFTQCTSLETVKLPKDLYEIGEATFAYCSSLKEIDIPDGTFKIRDSVFYDCSSLKSINWSENLEFIGNRAFENCVSLETIDIPDGVMWIYDSAFYGCSSLKVIELPESLKYLGESVFGNCIALEEIRVPMTIEEWNALEKHAEWSKDLLWPCKIVCTDGEIPHVEIK